MVLPGDRPRRRAHRSPRCRGRPGCGHYLRKTGQWQIAEFTTKTQRGVHHKDTKSTKGRQRKRGVRVGGRPVRDCLSYSAFLFAFSLCSLCLCGESSFAITTTCSSP